MEQFANLNISMGTWVALIAVIGVMLAIDLLIHRGNHEPSTKRAVIETAVWVACGIAFAFVVLGVWGSQAFGEYLSGYLIEKSLSIDNVFVWAIIFSSFAIPLRYQHRVLFWGIFGALILRAIFIFAGSALLDAVWWMLLVFGGFLVVTGIKVARHKEDEGEKGHDRAVKLLGRFLPVSKEIDGGHFLTRKNGVLMATPLLAALVVVEFTDVIFAIDSVPAILAVSREPFIVFASNAFAILGLRAMYFLLADLRNRFHYLSHALGFILIFVGVKMMVSHWWHAPTYLSLAVILIILVAAVIASEIKTRRLIREGVLPATARKMMSAEGHKEHHHHEAN